MHAKVVTFSEDTVTVVAESPFSGSRNEMIFSISPSEWNVAYAKWNDGALIQDAFSMLNDGEREFIITGITPAQFDNMKE
jgi:hypothetical protein